MAEAGADEARWRDAVAGVLKGASFEDRLTSLLPDGARLQPIYARKAGALPIPGRPPASPWTIIQRADHPDVAPANGQLLEDLEGGAGGVALVTTQSPFARGFGVAISTPGNLDGLLAGVLRNAIEIRLEAGPQTLEVARWLSEIDGGTLHYGYDPIGLLATTGNLPTGWPSTASVLANHRQGGTVLTADGRPLHEAGATPGLELAGMLSAALSYLRVLEATGLRLEEARHCVGFAIAADQDVFTTIAKLRALRLLWLEIEDACDLAASPIHIHAETAWRMLSRRDPATNMLRNGLAAAAAGLGGADSIAILPHTAANGLADAHARRVARNCQHVLISEANLHRIADPAAGSGGLEAMTDALREAGWAQFQAIERQGGIINVIQSGWLQEEIERLRQPVGTIIGANKYALAKEPAVSVLRPAPADTASPAALALSRRRDAVPFESAPESAPGGAA
ncbi:methylmalonyl-CoA mutase [Labrys okinawensis]|uniref:Methylmalonyl-CoA mutase n=1 Tax=Labrys okinawensis TaxID=346911 RepID=A0A2S9QFC0_9HYPH|nr:methylmalonyl-CoA mutase family protein [Labrys okinawensis]PRH88056.1 methylmalonyl-CoA mutase [Labrys okinawensis]